MKRKWNPKKWKGALGAYFFFLLVAIGLHAYFLYYNVDFNDVCKCDSRMQIAHFYPFLNQEYSQGNFMWSWNNGLGGDMFSEFIFYFATSPFFWLTMPLDIATIQDAFHIRIFVSMFKVAVAMIFMYHLLRYNKRTQLSSIVGSLIYCGSLYLMFYSLRFDFLADGLVWLPLLILGFERMIDHQKKGMFVGLVFLIVCSNFYLAFCSTVFLYLYAALKYFLIRNEYRWGDFFKYYLQISLWYIVGVLLSLFALLPVIDKYLQIDRFYYKLSIPLFFDWSFYQNLLHQIFLFPEKMEFIIVMPIIVLLLIFYGFLIKEKQVRYRMIFVAFFFILLLLPFTYAFFHGFAGIHYRWLYLFLFVVAQTSAFILDHLLEKPHRKAKLYFTGIALFLIIMVIFKPGITGLPYSRQEFVIGALGLLTIGCFFAMRKLPLKVFAALLIGFMTLNILFTNWLMFEIEFQVDPNEKVEPYNFKIAQRQQHYLNTYDQPKDVEMFKEIEKEDPTFFRTMWEGIPEFNAPMVYGYRGFSTYNSLLSGTVHSFFKNEYNVLQYNTPSVITNLDNRLYIETALGNKYYVVPKDSSWKPYTYTQVYFREDPSWKPYGYTLIKETKKFKIYRNDYALPIGFLYDSIVDKQTFDKLNFAERDQLLLRAAVVDNRSKVNLPTFPTNQLQVQEKVITNQDIQLGDQNIKLEKATLKGNVLTAEGGAVLTIPNPFAKKLGESLVEAEIKLIRRDDGKTWFRFKANDKMFWDFGKDNMYNYPKKQIVINTGHEQAKDEIRLEFSPGTYELNRLSLQFNSLEPYPELVKQKREQSLQNVSFDSTHVKGDINAAKDGILYLSIPYSKGWTAKVDGKEVETMKVNSTFVGIPITRGEHKVELSYFTPYLLLGTAISSVTLLGLIGYFWWERNRNRYKVRHPENPE
ncbi:putative membrane protein YfhO [Croceifilum oryzae]|uniref:Membrane protein YfhO n=1 Tax=Croceifilum oryzae TaxID=1553429 RepID=A0AAJ1TCT2_9BACL|nr:YfhO family protein [Croceifilum oryzae]MDQ0416034.1 putative membrane protein YfhO [Croceifilum oryzae]